MSERVVELVQMKPRLEQLPQSVSACRVAAYARVSTSSDEQLGSIEAQKDYFEKLIRKKPEWVLVGIYADEGISGTSLNHREAFNRMITDAMDGKIDLIVTKSLSRFARNTVDTLNVIRKLKLKDVGVYFEKEDISTLDGKGEFLLTIMSSIAEEESRSISENVKWGHRKRFADGKYYLPYKQFLGYKRGENGIPEIVEEEAVTIRLIFRLFLDGYSAHVIAKKLSKANILTPSGLKEWYARTVKSILKNEKYYGAALLQKTFKEDYRDKYVKVNRGELPKYYVENGHEGIITKEIFDLVQEQLCEHRHMLTTTYELANKLVCGECGYYYGPVKFHSSTYNDLVWKCCRRYSYGCSCGTPHLYDVLLKPIFHEVIASVLQNTPGIIHYFVSVLNEVRNGRNGITKKVVVDAVINHDINSETEISIWRTIVQKVVVYPGHLLKFCLLDGSKFEYQMERTTPRSPRGNISKSRVIEEYNRGKSIRSISEEKKVSINTVRSIIRRYKVCATTEDLIVCQNCGKGFRTFSPNTKYCSPECYREKRFGKQKA